MRKLAVGVKAFIVNTKNQYLILKRSTPYYKRSYLQWDIPGGRIDEGEKIEHALKREIKEETSLTLNKIEKILFVQDILREPGKHTVRITFLVKATGIVKLSKEHIEYKWISLNEFKKYKYDIFLKPVLKIL